MKKIFLLPLIFVALMTFRSVEASLPIRINLEQLVKKTDHIFIGHVFDVDMIDGDGEQIYNSSAKTGPGLDNKIRLLVKVEEIYTNKTKAIPRVVKIPLDSFMHYSFGQIKDTEKRSYGKQAIFLLSGADFQPPIAGHFMRGMNLKKEILKLKGLKSKPVKRYSKTHEIDRNTEKCAKNSFLWTQQMLCNEE